MTTIAFLYNVRHHYPDPKDPRTFLEADFDDQETIDWMIKYFNKLKYHVLAIEANEKAYLKLYKYKKSIDLAFNYSMGLYGKDGYSQLPAMMEMLQIPYTGSRSLTQSLVMNKAIAKQIMIANKIPTLTFQIFKTGKEELKKHLTYPLIVKPVARGSSAGITNNSVVDNKNNLIKQINFINKTFKEAALVEPFLTGREFSVAMLGNPPKILPIIESDHSKLPKHLHPLDSLEVKWIFEEQTNDSNLICPAKIDKKLEQKLKNICLKVWQSLNILDFCRIDIRCDKNLNPFVLEVNSPPGLIPPEISMTSYFPLAARTNGINYKQLILHICNAALVRNS